MILNNNIVFEPPNNITDPDLLNVLITATLSGLSQHGVIQLMIMTDVYILLHVVSLSTTLGAYQINFEQMILQLLEFDFIWATYLGGSDSF